MQKILTCWQTGHFCEPASTQTAGVEKYQSLRSRLRTSVVGRCLADLERPLGFQTKEDLTDASASRRKVAKDVDTPSSSQPSRDSAGAARNYGSVSWAIAALCVVSDEMRGDRPGIVLADECKALGRHLSVSWRPHPASQLAMRK